ncbi:unnamed protein product, partial [Phaeothamnion confervicola]
MDADYLKRTVGDPLSEALARMVVAQPTDAVGYIGDYLLNYVAQRKMEIRLKARAMAAIAAAEAAQKAAEAAAAEEDARAQTAKADTEKEDREAESALKAGTDIEQT